jgi:fructokinase
MSDAVVVWGELLWDRFPDGDRLGGAPANVAWHLGQLGGWPQLVTRVGNDADGQRAVEAMSQLIDTELVQIDPERATGEVTVRIENGEPRYTLHPGRAWERIECTDKVRSALATAGVLVYGTLAQRTPEGLAGWREASAAMRGTQVCDLNFRPSDQLSIAIEEAIAAAHVIKANDRELELLQQRFGWANPLATLRSTAGIVAITHGAAGATLYGDDGVIDVPGIPAQPGGDNVGCGDAFLAVLVYGLTSGWDLAMSGRAACRYASAVAGEIGATPLFDPELVAEWLDV